MKITKYGHCCLLIEVGGQRILTDPGKWSNGMETVRDIDLILITHEHADHFHTESLRSVLERSPNATVVTNSAVGKLMGEMGMSPVVLEGRDTEVFAGLTIEAFDGQHVEIFEDFGLVQNTGYLIAGELFYPGDAYTNPEGAVEILALPVAGPWCKVSDAINYARAVKPKKAFPVHDATLSPEGLELTHGLIAAQLQARGIEFIQLRNNETYE